MSFLQKYLSNRQKSLADADKFTSEECAEIATLASLDVVSKNSPSIVSSGIQELNRQRSQLKLIASENFSSPAVQLAMGNWLTDKYAEGSVKHRFYAGCEQIDAVEAEGIDLLKKIFQCEHASVQPHSGSDANLIAFWALLCRHVQVPELKKLGKRTLSQLTAKEFEYLRTILGNQTLMGMSLNSGGHLTHGLRANISGKMFRCFDYDVDRKTGLLDYDSILKKAREVRPHILLTGYSAYPRRINFCIMREIAEEIKAPLMVDMAHFAGLVAGKVLQGEEDPIPYADIITSTTHKTLRGPRGGIILCKEPYAEWIDKGCPLVMGGPLPHVMAAKAVAFREVLEGDFSLYADRVVENARTLANSLLRNKISLLTGGTDNHMIILHVTDSFGLTGKEAEQALSDVGIITNRNSVPWDENGPWHTSGIRIGTAALTTLGMGKKEMEEVGDLIYTTLSNVELSRRSQERLIPQKIREEGIDRIQQLMKKFPLYPHLPSFA